MKLWTNKSSRQQVLSSDSENEVPDVEYTSDNLTDNFNDEDLVSHCSDILQASPRSYVGGKRPRNWSGCQDTPSFGGPTQENVQLTEQSFTDYTQRIHNSRPTLGGKRPRIQYHNKQHPGPTFGGKRPRINHSTHNQSETPASCQKYEERISTIRRQQEEIAQLKAQGIWSIQWFVSQS